MDKTGKLYFWGRKSVYRYLRRGQCGRTYRALCMFWEYREQVVIQWCREQLSPILKHTKMKSRITIEVNFDEGNLPVIQILNTHSDDVRDKLISSFLQSLQHISRWCKIIYMGDESHFHPHFNDGLAIHKWHIVPITPKDIESEMKLMKATLQDTIKT